MNESLRGCGVLGEARFEIPHGVVRQRWVSLRFA
jgi:hypothetical protein